VCRFICGVDSLEGWTFFGYSHQSDDLFLDLWAIIVNRFDGG